MYGYLRALLFRLEAEQAHALTLHLLQLAGALPPFAALLRLALSVPKRSLRAFGLTFSNPVGLAAGYDKDGLAWRGLACLGFGHIEVGTVTPLPQPGNPRPRLFRLPRDGALINRMGFPSRGADFVGKRLQGPRPPGLVLGVNMGKNRHTPNEEAVLDYLSLMEHFAPLADYLVVNVSSPNTLGLRRLQARDTLERLLAQLAHQRSIERGRLNKHIPLLVKLSPDLSDAELDDALEVILRTGMDGVIVTNTTVTRPGLRSPLRGEAGGLSGAPLRRLSIAMVAKVHRRTAGKLPVVGVGGVMTPADAAALWDAGATLVQVYTGLVYAGPRLVREIVKAAPLTSPTPDGR